MHIISKLVVLFSFSVLVAANPSLAKTPDGKTPAEESICSAFQELKGPAFGLCNAYCEALDCGHPEQRANEKACDKINKNFERLTGFKIPDDLEYDEYGEAMDNCSIESEEPR
ncbi:hypothetical protein EY643_11595 [Halioglobus maricola]|uniref:Uncharacterized protein n=1 Tax=Halioglobus maricola TaxID=2601894 RepID=A0A5P9NK63_9GAMM|nr:hypothetical protein [Halioglobus maricola]QFU76253.1 hypothetical protein EY643_11595 [Halioglobus maricola]